MSRCVLAIAATDPSGGAGLFVDIKTATAHGCYGQGVVTAITAQNSFGILKVQSLPADIVIHQLEAIFSDAPPDAIKIGALGNAQIVSALTDFLSKIDLPPVVIDPVFRSSSGSDLFTSDSLNSYRKLLSLATIATPNQEEAQRLYGSTRPAINLLVTGGDQSLEQVSDVLTMTDGSQRVFTSSRIPGPSPHGTGCTLSSALASNLALGANIEEATDMAIRSTQALIAQSTRRGHGPHKSLNHEGLHWVVTDRLSAR